MILKNILQFFVFSLWFLSSCTVFAISIQDSTLPVTQVAAITQIRAVGLQTVGTVIAWDQPGNPVDMINDDGRPVWFDCDGSVFDTGYYTDLATLIPGGVLPNLKDQFLRGGTSAQVGQTAQDSTREHYHGQPQHTHSFNGNLASSAISGIALGQSFNDFYTKTDTWGCLPMCLQLQSMLLEKVWLFLMV